MALYGTSWAKACCRKSSEIQRETDGNREETESLSIPNPWGVVVFIDIVVEIKDILEEKRERVNPLEENKKRRNDLRSYIRRRGRRPVGVLLLVAEAGDVDGSAVHRTRHKYFLRC
jgi:hypothetical protein